MGLGSAVGTDNLAGVARYRRYPEYQNTDIEWLNQIPSHWRVTRLKRVCTLEYGDSLPNENRTWGHVLVYGSNGAIGNHECANTLGPCLVIGRKGSYGRVSYCPSDVFAIDTTFYVDRRGTDADIRWLYYLLSHIRLDTASRDSAIPGLDRHDAYARSVVICDTNEQRAIASFLDRETAKIDALVAKKERLIKLLQERRIALISDAVTQGLNPAVLTKDSGIKWLGTVPSHWQIVPVYARYDIALGKMLDTKRVVGHCPGRYIRNVDVQWDWVNVSDLPQMDFLPEERNRYRLELGDVLICEGGEVGRTAIWQGDTEECFFQKAIHRARPLTRRDVPRYLFYVMYAFAMRGVFVAGGNPNTIDHLTRDQLSHYRFAFPPSDEQAAIVKYLDRETRITNSFISKMSEAIDRLKEFRNALVSTAITGKIDVRDMS